MRLDLNRCAHGAIVSTCYSTFARACVRTWWVKPQGLGKVEVSQVAGRSVDDGEAGTVPRK
jgi:hypothetical protein